MIDDTPQFQTRRFAPTGAWLGVEGRFVERCGSSNDVLWQWVSAGAPHGAVVVAGEQTQGRGRQGRVWMSEPGQGLYLSCFLRPQATRAELSAFGLAAAVAVAACLEDQCGLDCRLKWPNDVELEGRKLAGLLLEARASGDALALVLGLGLNLRPPRAGWGELSGRAIALAEVGCEVSAEQLAAALCAQLGPAWDAFAASGVASFAAAWSGRDALIGRHVEYDRGGVSHQGVAEGIAADGSLRVRDAAGRLHALVAGEVHLRKSEPG